MTKAIVVYKSNYGTTEKYARWIAEETKADLYQKGQIKIGKLLEYDVIVYCGGLYAGGMLGFSFIKKNYEMLKHKKLIVVAVGATLKKADAIEEVKEHNLTPKMMDVPFFLLRGGLNYPKMSVKHRIMLYLLVKKAKRQNPDELDADSKGMIATYGKVVDFTNRNTIGPIVQAVLQ